MELCATSAHPWCRCHSLQPTRTRTSAATRGACSSAASTGGTWSRGGRDSAGVRTMGRPGLQTTVAEPAGERALSPLRLDPDDPLMTAGEVALLLRVTKAWVYTQTGHAESRTSRSGATCATDARPCSGGSRRWSGGDADAAQARRSRSRSLRLAVPGSTTRRIGDGFPRSGSGERTGRCGSSLRMSNDGWTRPGRPGGLGGPVSPPRRQVAVGMAASRVASGPRLATSD